MVGREWNDLGNARRATVPSTYSPQQRATSPRRDSPVPDVIDQELEALSDETGRSVSKLIREAVTSFIADAKKEAS
ncbi:ribbon-helix-helix domain-containing protein [Rhodococcus hoagii]|nr:ribbon-helix-helix domain-containing protein [Prescottella equi]